MSRVWPEGVVVRDGWPVFLCSCVKDCSGCWKTPCGRSQTYAPNYKPGGVTPEEARQLGWVRSESGTWLCPLCTGGEESLVRGVPGFKPKKKAKKGRSA